MTMRSQTFLLVAALAAIGAASLGLAGCADKARAPDRLFGLTSGPLPQPQPFVTENRTAPATTYPTIGTTPPARADKVLDNNGRKALEDSLLATPGRAELAAQAAAQKAADDKSGKKKKKLPKAAPSAN